MKRIAAAFSAGVLLLNILIMSALPAFAQEDPPGFEPISIYSLDNGKVDDSVPDASKKTPDGEVFGNPQTTADRNGNPNGAMLFDGKDDYIQTKEDSNIKPLTFSLWFRADDTSDERSLVDSDVSGQYGHSLIIGYDDPGKKDDTPRDGSLDVQYHNGFWDTKQKIEQGKWYHAFVTYGDNMQLYLGAEGEPMKLVAEQPYPTNSGFDGSKFRFGRHNANDPQWFKGAIDDVRFYDKALPKEVIEAIPTASPTAPPSPTPEPPTALPSPTPEPPTAIPTPSVPLLVKCSVDIPQNSYGDVHILTPDLLGYDFQESGDFILTRSTSGNVVVQARQEPWKDKPQVTINTAAAMSVGGDTIEFYMKPQPEFYVNGTLTSLPSTNLDLPGGGRIIPCDKTERFVIAWPDGNTAARVIIDGSRSLNIGVARLAGTLTYEGLIGNLDKNSKNDVQLRGEAAPLAVTFPSKTMPVAANDFKKFGDSWRVPAGESLFKKPVAIKSIDAPGAPLVLFSVNLPALAIQAETPTPESATADGQLTLDDLDPAARKDAFAACQAAGISEGLALYSCIYDVAATGDKMFIESAKGLEEDLKTLPASAQVNAPPAMLEPVAQAPTTAATEAPTAVLVAATAAPAATAVAPVEVPASSGGLFANPLVLAVIGVVVVALAAMAMMRRR